MKFEGHIRKLGHVDYRPLKQKVLSLDEKTWFLDSSRQEGFAVHSETKSIVLLFCEGWPNVQVNKRDAWGLLAPQVVPLVQHIIQKEYSPGGTVLRAMIANMPSGATITTHRDQHPTFGLAHRIHVPLQTNDEVIFNIENQRQIMAVGEAYEINNLFLALKKNGFHPYRK